MIYHEVRNKKTGSVLSEPVLLKSDIKLKSATQGTMPHGLKLSTKIVFYCIALFKNIPGY